MRRALASLAVVALLSTSASGQAPAATSSFDVADVHVRPHSNNPTPFMSGGVLRGGRYDLRNATMLNLITEAYGVDAELVVGGPNWLDRNRFDIIAKAPSATTADGLKLMMQSLLSERFKLVMHKDTRPVPGFALSVVGAKPKIKEATEAGSGHCEYKPNPQAGPLPPTTIMCRGITMETFSQEIRGWGQGYVTSRVVDLTRLTGKWDFDLTWTGRNNIAQTGADAVTLFAALEQQLGLKLDYQRAPAPVLVVDSVSDNPTANPSGIARDLPAPPPGEFDVATIKLSPPDAPMSGRLQPGGRLDFQGATMKMLVTIAWDINDDELLAGAPKWFDTTKYSLVARMSSAAVGDQVGDVDIDDLRLMLRALLTERFKLATHVEDRPVSAYTLLAVGPKLQPADPSNRTTWINGPAPGAKDPRDTNPILNRFITCQNMTMTQFAEDLTRMAGGYIKEPVVDATGLSGAYDFTLSFTGVNRLQTPVNRGGEAGAAGMLSASDPNGALSLFDALPKQLGLRLELRKRPMPVLVIDHIEEQPSDN